MKIFSSFLIMLFCSAAAVAVGNGDAESEALPLEELRVFAEVFGKIKSEYVDSADDVTLLRDAIDGMLAGLDPHSTFLDPESFKDMRISTEGKFGGLGIEVTTEDGLIRVVAPIDDTPAYEAGIQPGDIIVMIDGVPVRGMSLREAVDNMRGPPGSKTILTISREGKSEVFDVPIVRAIIKVASVRSELLEDDFGYLRITSFQSGTGDGLRRQLKKLAEENDGELKGLVLDLRNNPGGVLNSAVEVSDLFLDSGVIVSTRGRHQESNYSFTANGDDVLDDAPVVVLINGGSASASEIVAGALQDHQRAIVMGTRSFGKGSVQTVIPMNNGGALKITTARYYTPLGRSIQARGIEPDIVVEQAQLNSVDDDRREIRESDLAGHLQNDREAAESDNEEDDAQSDLPSRDYQVREALNLLKGMSLVKLRDEKQAVKPDEG